jgi:aminoglycoside phosphotransferase (APT) family kinase protein
VTGSADPAGPGAAYPLPLTADGVTAAWLTAALRTRYPGVTVAAADRLETIEGTATKVLVAVRYDGDADGPPERMWIKGGFADHREFAGNLGVYSSEVLFFTDIAPAYRLHHPRSYFALAQDAPVQGIVALEDLRARGVTFPRATRPMTPEQVAAGLDTLAQLHGETWGRYTPGAGSPPLIMDRSSDQIWDSWFAELPQMFAAPRAFAAPVALHDPDRLRAAARAYRAAIQGEPRCLVHGDPHIGNAYVERDGTVGFVDWQVIAIGNWYHDVNYFIVSALDLPDRRAHEHDLLAGYLKTLASYGVPVPGSGEAWESYRRATVYGFLCWLCNLDIWQPPDVNTATFARFGLAMLDHDTYEAIGV